VLLHLLEWECCCALPFSVLTPSILPPRSVQQAQQLRIDQRPCAEEGMISPCNEGNPVLHVWEPIFKRVWKVTRIHTLCLPFLALVCFPLPDEAAAAGAASTTLPRFRSDIRAPKEYIFSRLQK
jgi:hypothetical protein